MKPIDFSCKHDVWIRNPDGSLQRMDEPFFQAEKIAPGTWKILSDGDFQYLVEGDSEAVAIDTGYGAGNIRESMQKLTDKPLRVAFNTHEHFDHTANNAYFDKCYMTAGTAERATVPFPSFAGIEFPRDYEKEIVSAGYVYDLGNRKLEVLEMDFHAHSLLLLDRKERILFSGDEIMRFGVQLKPSRTVFDFYNQIKVIASHRDEFDVLCGGGECGMDASLIDGLLKSAEYVLGGGETQSADSFRRSRLFRPAQPDPEGRLIYERKNPRREDMGHPGSGDDTPKNLREVTLFGVRFAFDGGSIR